MTRCRSRTQIQDWLECRLSKKEQSDFADHLHDCAKCRVAIENLIGEATDCYRPPRAPDDLPSMETGKLGSLLDRIKRDDGRSPPNPTRDAGQPSGAAESPRIIGQYELLEFLGAGGMGSVYKSRHRRLDRLVALKLLSPSVTHSPTALARFDREMRAVGKLDHPQIVRAMDAGVIDGTHYLAMEFVEGLNMSQLVRQRGPLPVAEACGLIRQAALGMDAAHAAGLVHRDIKPSNLMVTADGQVKILDFGLARLAEEVGDHTEITSAGQVMGTPDFMSPEQWDNSHAVGSSSDLYSLGCTFYFLLTGRPPFASGEFPTTASKMHAHLQLAASDLTRLRAEIPPQVNKLVQRLLVKDPRQRLASARELAEELAALNLSATGFTDGLTHPVGVSHVTSMDLHPTRLDQPSGVRRRSARPWWILALLGVGIGLAAVGIRGLEKHHQLDTLPVAASGDPQAPRQVSDAAGGAGVPQAVVSTPSGYAMEFDGIQSIVQTPLTYDGSYPLTIEAWVTWRNGSGGTVASNQFDGKGHFTGLYNHQWLQSIERGTDLFSRHRPMAYERTHLASTFDNGECRFFVNGKPTPLTLFDPPPVSKAAFALGQIPDSRNPLPFNGYIHAVRFSRRICYHDEFVPSPQLDCDDSTLALYDFHEGAGNVLHDQSPARRDAKIHGARWVHADSLWNLPGLLSRIPRDSDGRQWQLQTALPNLPRVMAWRPGADELAFADNSLLRFHRAGTLMPIRFGTSHAVPIHNLKYSPDGKWLASAAWDRTVRIWDAESGNVHRILRNLETSVNGLAWSPDSKLLATGGDWGDPRIFIWDLEGTLKSAWQGTGNNEQLSWSPDGRQLAAEGNDGLVKVWTAGGELLQELKMPDSMLRCCEFSPDGKWLACALSSPDRGGSLLGIWSTDTWMLEKTSPEPRTLIHPNRLQWAPDNKRVLSVWQSAAVQCWDIEQNRRVFFTPTDNFTGIAADSRFDNVLVNPAGRSYQFFDPDTWKLSRQLGDRTMDHTFFAAVQPTDGRLALVSQNVSVLTPEGQPLWSAPVPRTYNAYWSRNGNWLAILCGEQGLRMWSSDGVAGPTLSEQVDSMVWHPDDDSIIVGTRTGGLERISVAGDRMPFVRLDEGSIVHRIVTSSESKRVLADVSGRDGQSTLMIFNSDGVREDSYSTSQPAWDISCDKSGKRIAGALGNSRIAMAWNSGNPEPIFTLQWEDVPAMNARWNESGQVCALMGANAVKTRVRLYSQNGMPGPELLSTGYGTICWMDAEHLLVSGMERLDVYRIRVTATDGQESIEAELVRSPPLAGPFGALALDLPRSRVLGWYGGSVQAVDLQTCGQQFTLVPIQGGRMIRIEADGRIDAPDDVADRNFVHYSLNADGSTSLLRPSEWRGMKRD